MATPPINIGKLSLFELTKLRNELLSQLPPDKGTTVDTGLATRPGDPLQPVPAPTPAAPAPGGLKVPIVGGGLGGVIGPPAETTSSKMARLGRLFNPNRRLPTEENPGSGRVTVAPGGKTTIVGGSGRPDADVPLGAGIGGANPTDPLGRAIAPGQARGPIPALNPNSPEAVAAAARQEGAGAAAGPTAGDIAEIRRQLDEVTTARSRLIGRGVKGRARRATTVANLLGIGR